MSNPPEIAVLMAAGKGERMRPLTLSTPKPLVKVHGTPMIETMIAGLRRRNVEQIYITVGYLGEQFEYLKYKYNNVVLIKNAEYISKNNISSIYSVRNFINSGIYDCFICEADIYIYNISIFDVKLDCSCYFGKMVNGYSRDWLFETNSNGRIIRIGRFGNNCYNMCGICYLKSCDARIITNAVVEAYNDSDHAQLYWDEIVNNQINNIYMIINPVKENQITEIDTIDELKSIDTTYER